MGALQSVLVLTTICSVLGGCAAPIISHDRSQESHRTVGGAMEGFTYYLAKSTPKVVFRVRLENCQTPTVTVLAPETTATAKADSTAQFRVTPTDAFNLFRNLESKLTLTADGRLGSASARSEDKTIAVLTQFLKDAGTVSQLFQLKTTTEMAARATPPASPCSDEANWLVWQRDIALKTLQNATLNESDFLAEPLSFKKGVAEAQKTYVDALTRLRAKVDELNMKLTKSTFVQLDVAASDDAMTQEAFIDITHGWFEPGVAGGCAVARVNGKDDVVVADSNCLRFTASVKRPSGAPSALDSGKPTPTTSGVWYRKPVKARVDAQVSRDRLPASVAVATMVEIDGERPLLVALPSVPTLVSGGKALDPAWVTIPQWGTLARMPMDVGLLTTNEVRVEFDEWSVPKSVEWKVAPSTIPGLLGLVPQASAAFAKPTTDPTAALRGDLLTQLLQACIAALASGATVPSYCSSILK